MEHYRCLQSHPMRAQTTTKIATRALFQRKNKKRSINVGDFSILIRMQMTFNVGQIALIHHISVPRYEPLPKYDQGQKGGELYYSKGHGLGAC